MPGAARARRTAVGRGSTGVPARVVRRSGAGRTAVRPELYGGSGAGRMAVRRELYGGSGASSTTIRGALYGGASTPQYGGAPRLFRRLGMLSCRGAHTPPYGGPAPRSTTARARSPPRQPRRACLRDSPGTPVSMAVPVRRCTAAHRALSHAAPPALLRQPRHSRRYGGNPPAEHACLRGVRPRSARLGATRSHSASWQAIPAPVSPESPAPSPPRQAQRLFHRGPAPWQQARSERPSWAGSQPPAPATTPRPFHRGPARLALQSAPAAVP